jgi:hypothetical protein
MAGATLEPPGPVPDEADGADGSCDEQEDNDITDRYAVEEVQQISPEKYEDAQKKQDQRFFPHSVSSVVRSFFLLLNCTPVYCTAAGLPSRAHGAQCRRGSAGIAEQSAGSGAAPKRSVANYVKPPPVSAMLRPLRSRD